MPLPLEVERRDFFTAPDVGPGPLGDDAERPLDPVVDVPDEPWTEHQGERPFRAIDRLPRFQTRGVFVDLDDRAVAFQADNLSRQAQGSHLDEFVHFRVAQS